MFQHLLADERAMLCDELCGLQGEIGVLDDLLAYGDNRFRALYFVLDLLGASGLPRSIAQAERRDGCSDR
ncbi:hypothetical protein IE4872_CH01769 [Rhizobium gallicum]|uniref:Uncharacterized protein n=1 Tax=Rhizobium gallicum TaxID=56730 RepID=A0A1L5NHQ5_9HYPH|nr:hypothetical protein [Rhizobium gallicum]APO67398.1 hypothetical protein IE4872_CH01769 [Rhizobium gallicum]